MTIEDPVARLSAGLDRDEQLAQAPESWSAQGVDAHGMRRVTVDHSVEFVVACTLAWRGEHMARHDPARALRQAEALRRALAAVRDPKSFDDRHSADIDYTSFMEGVEAAADLFTDCLASIYPEEKS